MVIHAVKSILLVDIVVFSIYVVDILRRFGIPINLSITYYRYERIRKHLGMLFPALMFFICATTVPIWFLTSLEATGWGRYFTGLPVVAEICLLLVALSARYKRRPKLIYFHYGCAIVTAACAVAWMCFVARQMSLVAVRLGILSAFIVAGSLTRTLQKCTLFWLELTAFYAIFFTLFLIHHVPLQL